MKERPILFQAAMVRALLDGSKTQTRRLCKPMSLWVNQECREVRNVDGKALHFLNGAASPMEELRCPYGQPGDRLWVRENFRFLDSFDADSSSAVGDLCLAAGYSKPWAPTQYEADGEKRNWMQVGTPPHAGAPTPGKGRPSIHMPRWASRILLELVSVRVERLQDISEADAIAEGIEPMPCAVPDTRVWRNYDPSNGWTPHLAIPQNSYRSLWDSINGAESWAANPWVWVVEVKRIQPEVA